jgi:hypothetical protein
MQHYPKKNKVSRGRITTRPNKWCHVVSQPGKFPGLPLISMIVGLGSNNPIA